MSPSIVSTAADVCDLARELKISFNGHNEGIAFLEQLLELKQIYNISEQSLLSALPFIFKGDSLMWLRNLRSGWRTLQDFVNDFSLQYLPYKYQTYLQDEIRNRKQRSQEKFSDYVIALQTLLRRSGLCSEKDKLEIVYNNMLPRYKMYIRRNSVNTLRDLTAAASEYEQITAQQEKTLPVRPNINRLPTPVNNVNNLNVNRSRQSQVCNRAAIVSNNVKKFHSVTAENRICIYNDTCFKCGQRGHSRVNCVNRSVLFCSKCGKRNVYTKDCCVLQKQPMLSQSSHVSSANNRSVVGNKPWPNTGSRLQQNCQKPGVPLSQTNLPAANRINSSSSPVQGRTLIPTAPLSNTQNTSCLVLSATAEDEGIGGVTNLGPGLVNSDAAHEVCLPKSASAQAAIQIQPPPSSQMDGNGPGSAMKENTTDPGKSEISTSKQSEILDPPIIPLQNCSLEILSVNNSCNSSETESANNLTASENCIPNTDKMVSISGKSVTAEENCSALSQENGNTPSATSSPSDSSSCVLVQKKSTTSAAAVQINCASKPLKGTVLQETAGVPKDGCSNTAATVADEPDYCPKVAKDMPPVKKQICTEMVPKLRDVCTKYRPARPLPAAVPVTGRQSKYGPVCSPRSPILAGTSAKLDKSTCLTLPATNFNCAATKVDSIDFLKLPWPPPPVSTDLPAAA